MRRDWLAGVSLLALLHRDLTFRFRPTEAFMLASLSHRTALIRDVARI